MAYDLDAIRAKSPGRAPALVLHIEKTWRQMNQGKKPDFEVGLWVATPFGIRRVVLLSQQGPDTILLTVESPNENTATGLEILYVPVEQCAFMFQHFKPTSEKERIIVGFHPPESMT
jgi:hypothetical protein